MESKAGGGLRGCDHGDDDVEDCIGGVAGFGLC